MPPAMRYIEEMLRLPTLLKSEIIIQPTTQANKFNKFNQSHKSKLLKKWLYLPWIHPPISFTVHTTILSHGFDGCCWEA
jgi:hypothetical protein